VQVIGDHELRLTFDDGAVGDVAFDESYWTGVFEPLRDPEEFAKVETDGVTIVWPKHGLDMAPEPLYEDALKRPARTGAPPPPPAPAPSNLGHPETRGGLGPFTR
jgi:hypothetical protein